MQVALGPRADLRRKEPPPVATTAIVPSDARQTRLGEIKAAWELYRQKQSSSPAAKQDHLQAQGSVDRLLTEISQWNCLRHGRLPKKGVVRQVLRLLWDEWQKQPSSADRLALLASMANGFRARVSKQRLRQMRATFDGHKHQFDVRGDCAIDCGRRAEVRHHIVPLTHGGGNGRHNLIAICKNCHAVIHPWLPVTLPNEMSETMVRVAREPDVFLATAA